MPLIAPSAFLQAPPIQPVDVLGSYLRGQMAPLELQQAQQQTAMGGIGLQQAALNLEQMRSMMGFRQALFNRAQQEMGGAPNPAEPQQQSSATGGGSSNGGINPAPATTSTQSGAAPSGGGLADPSSIEDPTRPLGLSPQTQQAMALLGMGQDVTNMRETALKTAQFQARGPMDLAKSVITSPAPEQLALRNPTLLQGWQQYAGRVGANAGDLLNARTPQDLEKLRRNIRAAATLYYNDLAGRTNQDALPMPDVLNNVNLPFGEVAQVSSVTGKKVGDLVERQPVPTYEYKAVPDPNDPEKINYLPVQTGGYRGGGYQGPGGAPGQGSSGPAPIPGGYAAPPTPDQTRAAGLAMSMRTGMANLQRIERSGFTLTPSDRAAIVGVISEQGGPLGILTGGALSSLPLQELLAHKLSPEGQTYLASLMPVLQGIGHHLGGQRLNDVQIKALLESVAPIDTNNAESMKQINANRNGYYSGLLGEAGVAREMRVYGGTLKSDYDSLSKSNAPDPYSNLLGIKGGAPQVTKVLNGKTYVSIGNGRWREQ